MFFNPVIYDMPLFRPPAEAYASIIQATIGCSWNQCSFCEMYTSKNFRIKPEKEVFSDIKKLAQYHPDTRKVFIADGNAMVLSSNKILNILSEIKKNFNKLQRVSAYALPKDIMPKSLEDLKEMRKHGLKLLYIGIETGDDALLSMVNKGETFKTTVEGISKAHQAGIDTSIMIINGLGGRKFSSQHALNSARIINALNPKFLSTLTLSLPFGVQHYQKRLGQSYEQQTLKELFIELKLFIENLDVHNVIFRSNHVSNNITLEGTLSKDQARLVNQLEYAIEKTPSHVLPESPDML